MSLDTNKNSQILAFLEGSGQVNVSKFFELFGEEEDIDHDSIYLEINVVKKLLLEAAKYTE